MAYEIYSNVPAPATVRAGRPSVDFPFHALEIGQSFFVPLDGEEKKTVLNRVRTKAQRWKKSIAPVAIGLRISPLNNPETGVPSIGVWRLI